MKRLLVHREGQSGHFFLALLEKFDAEAIRFRIPDHYISKTFNLEITHEVDFVKHSRCYDQIIRILPQRKIYHCIYNNFMKKLVVEQATEKIEHWRDNLTHWYDTCYYNIQEYHALIQQDVDTNQYINVINFDLMLDENYMHSVLKQYFDQDLDVERRNILQQYRALQIGIDLDLPHCTMRQIVDQIPDVEFEKNPWFFAYCIFKFETNNGLLESSRQWSINDITRVQYKNDLLELAKCYEFDSNMK